MIGYLRGEILEHSAQSARSAQSEGRMLVIVSGVGYQVQVPQSAEYGTMLSGQTVSLFIHTHVREDALDLYGFSSRMERDLFLTLLSVNGIGPKGALGVLSRVRPEVLIQAVMNGDKDSLTEIPGIGKKTAERIVLELGDKIRKKIESGELVATTAPMSAKPGSKAAPSGAKPAGSPVFNDAKSALIGLGYKDQDVTALLNRVMAEEGQTLHQAEDVIRAALRQLV